MDAYLNNKVMKTLILLLLLLPVVSMNKGLEATAYSPKKVKKAVVADSITLTIEERIVTVLRDSGFSRTMQRIILAQAKHESGNFKSRLARNHNNIFGMTHPGTRHFTTSLGPLARAEGRGGYASYTSIEHSVADYILYKKRRQIEDSEDVSAYIYQLKRKHYFEARADKYLKAINRWMLSDTTVRNFSTN